MTGYNMTPWYENHEISVKLVQTVVCYTTYKV
jgi:hypothetical protein